MKGVALSSATLRFCGYSLIVFVLPTLAVVHASVLSNPASAPASQKVIKLEIPSVGSGQHWAVAIETKKDSLQDFQVSAEARTPLDPSLRPQFDPSFVHPITTGFTIGDSVYQLNTALPA